MSVIVPSSTCGRSASCWALLKRWISSMNRTVGGPPGREPLGRRGDQGAHVGDAAHDARRGVEASPDRVGQQAGQGRLADARRAPQEHRGEVAASQLGAAARARRPGGPGRRTPRASRGRMRAASGACWSGGTWNRPPGGAPEGDRRPGIRRSLRAPVRLAGPDLQDAVHTGVVRVVRLLVDDLAGGVVDGAGDPRVEAGDRVFGAVGLALLEGRRMDRRVDGPEVVLDDRC